MVILKEDTLLKPDKAQSKCPTALDQFIFKVQLDKTTASLLPCELGGNGEKKVNGNRDINKNGRRKFHFGKPGHFS